MLLKYKYYINKNSWITKQVNGKKLFEPRVYKTILKIRIS